MAEDTADIQPGPGGWQESDLQKNLVVTAEFKDHFSTQSEGYARYRPHYPEELFAYLASLSGEHASAWDCATGNGQVATALAKYYQKIIASDASAAQIAAAQQHPQVEYRLATAEDSGLAENSFDLVCAGQAFHWFDHERFLQEACRVLKQQGVLAIWCYEVCQVNAACDALIEHLYSNVVGEFWPPERVMIEQGYEHVQLPGELVQAPNIAMSVNWAAADMLGYLRTWSACERYAAANGSDPVSLIEVALGEAWGHSERRVSWPLKLKVCHPNSLLE
jgi:SAM-dependent methyltransferase